MNATFLSIIYFVAFSHAVMLGIALWRRVDTGKSGRLLAVVMGIMAYKLFEGGAEYSGFYQYVPHLLGLLPLMVMILGPVFYAYVRKTTGLKPFELKDWCLHLMPWVAMFLVFSAEGLFRTADVKIAMYDRWLANMGAMYLVPTEVVIRLLAVKVHLGTYLFLSWRSLNLFAKSVDNLRSDNSGDIVTKLRFLSLSFILLEAVWVSLFLIQQYLGLGTLSQVGQIWLLFIAVIVLAMGFSGLQNPEMVFTPEERLLTESEESQKHVLEETTDSADKVKYIHSVLPDSTTDEIGRLIEKAMVEDKLFLQDKLTLTELATHIHLTSHTVSQVINQGLKTNFYKMVNSYRVQHAASLLEDDNVKWPIERIALESGFANRVTFNKAFKELMQCTPSDYKRRERKIS